GRAVGGPGGAAAGVRRRPAEVRVRAAPVAAGLPTSGFGAPLRIAPGGTVTGGRGWLARPAAGAEYPLLSAADAVEQIVVPDLARLCGRKVCPTPPMVITGARLGLALRWNFSGQPLLVPAWRYGLPGPPPPVGAGRANAAIPRRPPRPAGRAGRPPAGPGEPSGRSPERRRDARAGAGDPADPLTAPELSSTAGDSERASQARPTLE